MRRRISRAPAPVSLALTDRSKQAPADLLKQ